MKKQPLRRRVLCAEELKGSLQELADAYEESVRDGEVPTYIVMKTDLVNRILVIDFPAIASTTKH